MKTVKQVYPLALSTPWRRDGLIQKDMMNRGNQVENQGK